jgi:hypothetical protein
MAAILTDRYREMASAVLTAELAGVERLIADALAWTDPRYVDRVHVVDAGPFVALDDPEARWAVASWLVHPDRDPNSRAICSADFALALRGPRHPSDPDWSTGR